MTCESIARAILTLPDWLTAFFVLFVAAVFGASAMCVFYEWRYGGGISYQLRREQIVGAVKRERNL